MGLAERRAVETFRQQDYPGFLAAFRELAAHDITTEVDWAALAGELEGYDDAYAALQDYFQHLFAAPLLSATAAICIDALGREALAAGLTKIIIGCSRAHVDAAGLGLEHGVLSLDMRYANTHRSEELGKALQTLLETHL